MIPEIEKAINEQIAMEAEASFSYLSMAVWCDYKGLEGTSQFFYRQSEEEKFHMMKLVEYLLEMDCKPVIPALGNVVNDYESVQSIFKQTLVQEKTVSQSIHRIIEMATQTNDHATNNFLQWYVAEQREEESMIRKIIDKIELIGNGPQSLYYIDKEMDRFNQAIIKNIEGEKGK